MITDPLFYAVAVPAVILVGLSKGGFRGLGLLSLPLMALVISPVQRGGDHAADPDRAGHGGRVGLSARLGRAATS